MLQEDPWIVLGLQRNASAISIRKAFKKLALQCHPDKSDKPSDQERFIRIHKAYSTLTEPILLDKYLEQEKLYQKQKSYEFDRKYDGREDEYEFDADNGEDYSVYDERENLNIYQVIQLTLHELYGGSKRLLQFERIVRCPNTHNKKKHCTLCLGNFTFKKSDNVSIKILPGCSLPQQYTYANYGHQSLVPDVGDGCLIVGTEYIDHHFYQRKGHNNLMCIKTLTCRDVMLGFVFELPALDNRVWKFSLLDQIVDFTKTYQASGYGLIGKNGRRGKLLIKFELRRPSRLITEKQDWIDQWKELDRDDGEDYVPLDIYE